MVKVITYGTYDLIHHGHIRLLERAKALGDYLIVGVTSDDFDRCRGKINVQQSLMERVEALRATGLADEIIIEEYEGQKIDDIKRYNVDIFTVGSDWEGHFDYLNEFCKVVYLERTQGISSTEVRSKQHKIKIGFAGDSIPLTKYIEECKYVNGIEIGGIYTVNKNLNLENTVSSYEELVDQCDALYIISKPYMHYKQIRYALERGKHVLCESPIALSVEECKELFDLANKNNCVLMDSIKTAYATAYNRLLLLVKSGIIGKIVSVDAVATSMRDSESIENEDIDLVWNSLCSWGPTAMLPIFQILGTNYKQKTHVSKLLNDEFDLFSDISFVYNDAVGHIQVGKGVKSEGELVIAGTKGYIYVPAPWWKTDYFEVRFENPINNKRYFYQLDGEGIRYLFLAFINAILAKKNYNYISFDVSQAICKVMEDFYKKRDVIKIG